MNELPAADDLHTLRESNTATEVRAASDTPRRGRGLRIAAFATAGALL